MPRAKKHLANVTRLAELSMAVPQVVSHRVARMALAGPVVSPRDRQEFTRMVVEKQVAFAQSYMGMAQALLRLQLQMGAAMVGGPRPHLSSALGTVMAKGIAPVHSKAVANAKRLAKVKLK
jgi:hypothetical protein